MMALKKRMLYSLDQLNKALDRVRNGGSIRGSSRLYGIPESTIHDSVTPAQIKRWFEEITAYIEEKHLESTMEKPTQIFNMDETAVRTTPTRDVVLAESNKNQVHSRVGNSEKESYTALFAGNVAGMLAPTMVLFPYKQRMPGEIFQRFPKGWAVGRTDSGWVTRDTFAAYLKDMFYPWLLREKIPFPIIMFVDGHSSHVSAESIAFCKS